MHHGEITAAPLRPGNRGLAAAWALAIGWQLAVIQLTTSDLVAYNLPWLGHIVAVGPVAAFAHPFGNYTPPYGYLLAAVSPLAAVLPGTLVIKLLSFGCTLLLTASASGP